MKKILLLALSFVSLSVFALDAAHFTIQRVTSPYFVVDGNAPTSGPLSAYVGFKITNTSAVTYNNLKFTITSIGSSVAGQNYSLVSPSNGINLAGTLAPGESKVAYYYVAYPANVTPQATFNYTLTDATASSKTGNFVIYNRSSISANAGGLATQSINNQDLIGGIVYDDVTYTLGNIRNGDEADFQVSVSAQFDPTKIVLLKTEIISSTVPGVTTGTVDKLYFTTTANQSSGTVTIRWTFRISAFNFTTLVLPYAGATSGSSNYKYAISSDLGSGTPITISSSANPLLISKSSDRFVYAVNMTAFFTVTIQNPGAYPITIDKITDQLPAGFSYQSIVGGSQITTSNSTSTPSMGATGTITFEGGVVSGGNTSFTIPAGGIISLQYAATTPGVSAMNLSSTARGYIGTTEFGSANNTVNVTATLPLTLHSFKGNRVDGSVVLNWSTASETSSDYFDIERSKDSRNFFKIGRVRATGTSSTIRKYSFTDSTATDNNYYRLKIVDRNGLIQYSNVVNIKAENHFSVTISPNPASGFISITRNTEQASAIQLLDRSGRVLYNRVHSGNRLVVDVTFLPAGNYILKVDGGSKQVTIAK